MKKNSLTVTPPVWRHDLKIEEDIIEEVGRCHGLDKLPNTPVLTKLTPQDQDQSIFVEPEIKEIIVGAGYQEVINYSFIAKETVRKVGLTPEKHIEIVNPLSRDQAVLRQELLSGLLENIYSNLKYFAEFKIFELGKVYFPALAKDPRPHEGQKLAGTVVSKQSQDLYFTARALVEMLLAALNIKEVEFKPLEVDEKSMNLECYKVYNLEKSASVKAKGQWLGVVGEINEDVLDNFDVEAKVGFWDLSVAEIIKLSNQDQIFQPLPKYPGINLDVAMVVEDVVSWEDIRQHVCNQKNKIIKKVELFDVYSGKGIESGKKSLAFHILYQDSTKTLSADEVNKIHENILIKLKDKFQAEIRAK